nr:MAG TPA: hypothetical protein [Caudoviricetes sp.]
MNLKILFFQILHYLQFYYHHKKYWVDCLNTRKWIVFLKML